MGAARTTLATLNDVAAAGGKVPPALGGTGSATASGSRSNLGVRGVGAVRGPGAGNVRVDPAERVLVHAGLYVGQGAPRPNLDGLNYNSFPFLVMTATGRLVCAYRRGLAHDNAGEAPGSYQVVKFSDDLGATWSATPTVVYGDLVGDVRNNVIFRATQGPHPHRLFCFLCVVTSTIPHKPSLCYSDDHGQTWTNPVSLYDLARLGPTNIGVQIYTCQPVELADGTLIAACYCGGTGITGADCYAYRSTDHGNTWTFYSAIEQGGTSGRAPIEPTLVLLDDASILCSIRYNADSIVRFFSSTDSGATWTNYATPVSTFPGASLTGLCQLATGALVAVTRGSPTAPASYTQYPNKDVIFTTSRDRGVTWEPLTKIDNRVLPNNAYQGLLEVAPGTLAVAYSVEYPVAGDAAEVDLIYLLDGNATSPLGGTVARALTASTFAFGGVTPAWIAPVAKTSGAILADLEANVNRLLDLLAGTGIMATSPKSLASCTGWWEADFIPSTINDLTAAFASTTTMTRTDGSTLAVSSTSGTWAASGTLSRSTSGGLSEQIVWDAGVSDLTVTADMVPQSNATPRLVLRRADASNYLYYNMPASSAGPSTLHKVIAGVDTTLATNGGNFTPAAASTFTVKAVLAGTVVTIYGYAQNGSPGAVTVTATLSAGDMTALGTKCGFTESGTSATFDNLNFIYGLADGDHVGLLTDQAVSLNLAQATTVNKPFYQHVINLFAERPALLFNGTHALASTTISQAQPNVMVGVFYFTATTAGNQPVAAGLNMDGSSPAVLYINAGSSLTVPAQAFPFGPFVVTTIFNGTSSAVRLSGRQVASGAAGAGGLTAIILGSISVSSLFYCAGLCMLNGATALADYPAAERYFALKYGIALGA